ncbi:MotA/TolQ/ExbB proton channel family protein [Massilia forsythiae]|uniref:MotA/TolQ/ExbB proton channel family protein n=1 Tax=Massilia forsythiae TaxID=2728020 RepID=A0A7Z2ZSM3_9BURK|nr:MotA/TolQ/ExbB proton channel family protein [Massilia forsythiae]QJD99111.1 MotA/TolQ/ExbB proton channel family protein [Massilia forsythiae]
MLKRLHVLFPCCLSIVALPARAEDWNLLAQLANGGIGIVVTGALSVLALAVGLERLVNLRVERVAPLALAEQACTLWRAGRFDELQALAAEGDSSLARIVGYLAQQRRLPPEALALRAGELAATELRLQQQKAYALNVVATIAPIVGLLGTVIGMIESFHVIAANGMGDPTMLAGGISKALVNTAAGLSVALPALAMHHFLRSRLVGIGIALERALNRLLDDMRGGGAPHDAVYAAVQPVLGEASHAH